MQDRVLIQQNAGEMEVRTILAVLSSLEPFRNMATIIEIQESKFEHLSDCAEQIVKHGKKLMHCLSELESKSGEHYMERYGKRRRGGMRDSDYDDEDYPRYY